MPTQVRLFPNVPTYHPNEDADDSSNAVSVKCFVIDRVMTYAAAVNAVSDRHEIRKLHLNTMEVEPGFRVAEVTWQEAFERFVFDENGRTDFWQVSPMMIGQDAVKVGLIDVVTFPFHFGLVHDYADTPQRLWEINHNILAPFLGGLSGWAAVLSSFHWNEQPVDDAPAHNIIMLHRHLSASQHTAGLEEILQRFPPRLVQTVTQQQRIMDSRCCLLTRQANDAPCRPLEIMPANEVVPAMIRAERF